MLLSSSSCTFPVYLTGGVGSPLLISPPRFTTTNPAAAGEMGSNFYFSHFPRALLAEDAPPPAGHSALSITPPSKYLRPNIAVITGVLTAMFSLTFLLLLYARHCKREDSGDSGSGAVSGFPATSGRRRDSGVERAVVEGLPVFRFRSLLGQKEGLECAVCLARFGPEEALRLLPKCRHAFHVECVDTWLDAHSSCPLCRGRVEPEDLLLVPGLKPEPDAEGEPNCKKGRGSKGSDGPANEPGRRVSGRHSSAGEKSTSVLLRVVVDRANPDEPKPRRSVDCVALRAAAGVGRLERVRKDGILPTMPAGGGETLEPRCDHRIVVSGCGGDGTAQERWSYLRPSDLLFLRTEMIITGSGRFSAGRCSCS